MRKIFFYIFCLITVGNYAQNQQKLYELYKKHVSDNEWNLALKPINELLTIDENNNYWLLTKAELEAKIGNHSNAIFYISKLINNGYRNISELENSKYFVKLQQKRKFKKIISNLKIDLSKYKVQKKDQDIVIDVPPMLECYVVMLYLSNPKHPLINKRQQHFYFKEIDAYFSEHKNNSTLLALKKLYPGNKKEWINNLRAHHNLRTLYFYDGFNTDKIVKFPVEIDKKLAVLVKQFAKETNFDKFYKENKEYYTAMKKIMLTNYSFGSKVIPFFNENFKTKINRFNIYFSPIYGGWQHGPKVQFDDYLESFYFGGIMYTNKKRFYYPDVNLLFTFLTEFDHTPVNTLTATYSDQLLRLKEKVNLLNKTGHVSYGNIESTVNEYVTWAFALQYFYENTPNEYDSLKKNIIYSMQKYRGFVKFGEFMKFYESYIVNRERYPKLKDFYPEILRWIQEL